MLLHVDLGDFREAVETDQDGNRDRDSRHSLTGRDIQRQQRWRQQRQTEKTERHRLTDKYNRDRQPDSRYRDSTEREQGERARCKGTFVTF